MKPPNVPVGLPAADFRDRVRMRRGVAHSKAESLSFRTRYSPSHSGTAPKIYSCGPNWYIWRFGGGPSTFAPRLYVPQSEWKQKYLDLQKQTQEVCCSPLSPSSTERWMCVCLAHTTPSQVNWCISRSGLRASGCQFPRQCVFATKSSSFESLTSRLENELLFISNAHFLTNWQPEARRLCFEMHE